MGGYWFVLGLWDSDSCSYWILYSLLYAQYGVVLEYDFLLLGSLSILIFFCVSVVFSHTESSFCVVGAFPFCFQRCCIAGFTGNTFPFPYLYVWNKRINALPRINGSILVRLDMGIVWGMSERLWVKICFFMKVQKCIKMHWYHVE